MSATPDKLELLQKIMAVKRHEQPPPFFFEGFSHKVLNRLHEPERSEPTTWWQRMGLDFDLKPAFVCAWGVAVCGSLIFGIISSLQRRDVPENSVLAQSELTPLHLGAPSTPASSARADQWAATTPSVLNPIMSPVSQFTVLAEPALYNLGFRNY